MTQLKQVSASRPDNFIESFTYPVSLPSTLTYGTTQSVSLQIQSDSDFLLVQTSIMVQNNTIAGVYNYAEGEHFSGIVCQITDGGSEKPLSNIPIPVCSLFGTGARPRRLPQKRLLLRNSVLIFTFTNLYTTASGNMERITVNLDGEKHYGAAN